MNSLFQKTSSHWVKYSEYECREKDGVLYAMPTPKAKPVIIDPLEDADAMVLDALNVGMLMMNRSKNAVIREALMDFVSKYGLLGFMTALPTTPRFLDYESAYLLKNHFIRDESMTVEDYTALFFPFDQPDMLFTESGVQWDISGDRDMMALAMTMSDKPMALNLCFQREYAERYDWLLTQFKDLAFTFMSSYLFYEDYDSLDEDTRNLYRQGMAAFGGIAPTYHIALLDKPTIVWDFHSLLLGIQMMLSFMITDETKPLRICKHCNNAFVAERTNAVFCSPRCKNQYNVYKSREKKK